MTLRIDPGFSISCVGRYIIIQTFSRKLTLYAPTTRASSEWTTALQEFYALSSRSKQSELCPTAYPLRYQADIEIYTHSCDYFQSVATALLKAKEEIFIAAWMISPEVILTRPPLPPTRLDQILKYKIDQGVQLYLLLNKQVSRFYCQFSHSHQSRQSTNIKHFFQKFGPNVKCIRHPNKFSEGTTPSHNERIVVVDR
jgi:phosphatidylserine/phosphatidylglycerophosphate/cardiolipin synthase-like enzyme